jgi:NAD(P)-dependent dehydrogenase (short-subunit alcohol dehydrogenase family)
VVTGGASGLGFATAERFAREGFDIGIVDWDERTLPGAAERLGAITAVHAQLADVTDEAAVGAFCDALAERFGPVDCVLNAAGNMPQMKPTLEQSVDAWQKIVDVHLRGTYLSSRAAGALAARTGNGLSIVNVGSIVGESAFPMRSEYGPAKAGITQLTRSLAIEWGDRGWRVNCIAPGYVRTESFAGLSAGGKLDEARLVPRIPLGRLGEASEFAELTHFVLTRATYLTGAVIPMDGGWLAYGYV